MIRRDYILRMIEEFVRALAKVNKQKQQHLWRDAEASLEEEVKRLTGSDLALLGTLTDTEILARLLQTGDFLPQNEKIFMLARILIEAAEVAEESTPPNQNNPGRDLRLKALHLLLNAVLRGNAFEWPEFVPSIDLLLTRLGEAPLPFATHALLMQHFERSGQFAKAEDALCATLDLAPGNSALEEMAASFYHRMLVQTDAALEQGNLPRTEVEAGLAALL